MSENINPVEEPNHIELLNLLLPLVEFLDENNYSYFLVAGKDGVCSRYLRGTWADLLPMLKDMAKKNECVEKLIKTTAFEMINENHQPETSN